MTLDFAAVLADAWGLFKRDRDLLLRVVGPFLFLPSFALALLVPPWPMPDPEIVDRQTQAQSWLDAFQLWANAYGPGSILAYAVMYYGMVVLFVLYCDRTRPDVRSGLRRAGAIYLRYFLAMTLVSLVAFLGLSAFVLPGLYVMGRMMFVGPLLAGGNRVGVRAAIRGSYDRSRGAGLPLMGLVAFTYLTGWLIGEPFRALDGWLRANGEANPVTLGLVDAGSAVVATVTTLATILVAVAAYRRLAKQGI